MKILKYLFFLILIAIIAGAIYIATKSGNYQVEESTIVNAPVGVVFNEVNNLYNWETWGPWRKGKNDVIINYRDVTRGEGAGFSWNSEDQGNGEITTTKVIPDENIEQEITFQPTFAESNGNIYWRFEEVEEGTKLTLGMRGKQSFKEKLAFAFKDESISQIIKPKFTSSLEDLNKEVVDKMSVYSINVDGVTIHGGGFYMYTTTSTKINQIPTRMQKMVTEVRNYMENNNIPQQGSPFVLYNDYNEQNNSAIYSTGIFTSGLVITPADSDILNGMMPVQKVVKTTLKGNTENLAEAWERTYQYISDNNLQADEEAQPFEVYKTDLQETVNPANLITEIYIPIIDTEAVNNQPLE